MTTLTIKQQLLELGMEESQFDTHESDLYVLVNDISKNWLQSYEFKENVTTFKSETDKGLWFDIPFGNMSDHINRGNKMENKNGFHMVESLNGENTRIALVWHNTKEVEGHHYNETVSKEVVDVIHLPSIIGKYLTCLDFETIAKRLMQDNNITDCAINFETV